MKKGLSFWIIITFLVMLVWSNFGATFDKADWIFAFLFVGLIVLNVKLNRILSLLEKKKK